jgi:RNA polymerase sigma-70 factor (ECF subfamily)
MNHMVDDKKLVARILAGDMHAFRTLITQHERLVVHMVGRLIKNKEEQEEICQDVFLKVFDKLKEFNFQSKLSTWIATIAYRQAINAIRKNRMQWTDIPEEESFSAYFVDNDDPEKLLEERDMDDYILRLVDLLPQQYKLVLTLFHLENMNYQEIGEITGMPEGTVKSYLFRARNLLKEKVKSKMIKEPGL